MPDIGLIVAMRLEVPDLFHGNTGIKQVGDNRIKVAISGIGQKRARRTTRKMCRNTNGFCPERLISLGFCGGTQDDLVIGQLIIANRLSYNDQEIELENRYLTETMGFLKGSLYRVGKLQTFNRPVFSKNKILKDTVAVDMESFAIAQTARNHHIPITFIKAVSDLVPDKATLKNLFILLKSMRSNLKKAKHQLNLFAREYFC
jgi:nucleoside phosphorylase